MQYEDVFSLYCNECKSRIVMHAFSEGVCERCGRPIHNVNTPCDKLCLKCAKIKQRCAHCGKKLRCSHEAP